MLCDLFSLVSLKIKQVLISMCRSFMPCPCSSFLDFQYVQRGLDWCKHGVVNNEFGGTCEKWFPCSTVYPKHTQFSIIFEIVISHFIFYFKRKRDDLECLWHNPNVQLLFHLESFVWEASHTHTHRYIYIYIEIN